MAQGNPIATIEALFFDVFGTLVDWRTTIAREAEAILKPLGHALDWLAFADAWRGEYQPGDGGHAQRAAFRFCKLDVLHRRNLERILPRFELADLCRRRRCAHLNLAWHRLDAWPDVPRRASRGSRRSASLRRYRTATSR